MMKHLEKNKCPIKGYKIIKDIGCGANAVVYLVRNQKTKKLFAMKEVTIRDNNFLKQMKLSFKSHKFSNSNFFPRIFNRKWKNVYDNRI